MSWKRDEGTVTAENPEDVANLLNNFFFSMFNKPLSQEDYVIVLLLVIVLFR
jgi:hypothetical protein